MAYSSTARFQRKIEKSGAEEKRQEIYELYGEGIKDFIALVEKELKSNNKAQKFKDFAQIFEDYTLNNLTFTEMRSRLNELLKNYPNLITSLNNVLPKQEKTQKVTEKQSETTNSKNVRGGDSGERLFLKMLSNLVDVDSVSEDVNLLFQPKTGEAHFLEIRAKNPQYRDKRWPNTKDEARFELDLNPFEYDDDDLDRENISKEEMQTFNKEASAKYDIYRTFLTDFFGNFHIDTKARELIDSLLMFFSDYNERYKRGTYKNAVMFLIPLMPHLIAEDCEQLFLVFNNPRYYRDYDAISVEPVPRTFLINRFLFKDEFRRVLPYASEVFLQTYCKMTLNVKFWENYHRLKNFAETLEGDLAAFYLKNHFTLLLDTFTGLIVTKEFNGQSKREIVADTIEKLDKLGLFCKALPVIKAAFKQDHVARDIHMSDFSNYFPHNYIKPALSDQHMILNDAIYTPQGVNPIKHKKRYAEEVMVLNEMTNFKIESNEVECNAIGCNVVGKCKDLSPLPFTFPFHVPERPPLLRCGRCKIRYYCSVACQKKSWMEGHKLLCTKLASISQYLK